MLPEVAEAGDRRGPHRFVAMGRQLLADPDLVNKLSAGTSELCRPCINCYVCVQENFFDDTPLCAVNPAPGQRVLLPLLLTRPASTSSSWAPPGGERARVLAERGHRVTVLDKSDRLGGTFWFSTLTTPTTSGC